MKTNTLCTILVALCLLGVSRAPAQQTTAFTYQGQLRDGGTNANGTYGLTFKLFNAATGGNQVGGTLTDSALLINGLFSVNLDFGSAFDGGGRWLDITVQAGASAPETLAPRVQVLPTPYALYANVAGTVTNGAIMNTQLAGNAVNTTNIQTNAITSTQIANGAVTNRNLAANAVNTTNIQDAAVTDEKIVSMRGSKVSGGVAVATNAYSLANGTWGAGVGNYLTYSDVFRISANNSPVLVLSTNGVLINNSVQVNGGLAVTGGGSGFIPQMQVFHTSGTFVVPTAVTRIMVEVWGGGGGGGGGGGAGNNGANYGGTGGGGGGAGYGKEILFVPPGSSMVVTVGSGGTGGQGGGGGSFNASGDAGWTGGAGGATSIGSAIATGGAGGEGGRGGPGGGGSAGASVGGDPGASTATISIKGQRGWGSYGNGSGGAGANGGFGLDGGLTWNGTPGGGGGGGGGGTVGVLTGHNGSFGAPGRVIVWW